MERYLLKTSLDQHLGQLDDLALSLADLMTTEGLTWPDRLRLYRWPKNTPFKDALVRVQDLLGRLREISEKVGNNSSLSWAEEQRLKQVTLDIFKWGGVTRGKSKRDPSIIDIRNVITTAFEWSRVGSAPLDSGWSKLAAFSTDYLEDSQKSPQVIYDSRVAFSLIRKTERLLKQEKFAGLRPVMEEHLRYIPGRGGNRATWKPIGWQRGWGRWESQFFASLYVRRIRDVLNRSPKKYGLMSRADGNEGCWTTRGVEMVLFMDGY